MLPIKTFTAVFGDAEPSLYVTKAGQGVHVLDVPARTSLAKTAAQGPHAAQTIVFHLPMANPLDANQLYHIATVAHVLPEYRIIAFGNPSSAPFHFAAQNLSLTKSLGVAYLKNLRPLVEAELEYLETHDIQGAHLVGYSYGAHKALIEAGYMPDRVASLTCLDPVAHPRGIKQLTEDFRRTFEPMGEYVNSTDLPTYFAARHEASRTNHHNTALRRPISWTIGVLLSRHDFIQSVEELLQAHPDIVTTVVWATDSELGNDAHVATRLDALTHRTVAGHNARIRPVRIQGATHSLANDVLLYAALIYESLQKPM